MRTFYANTGAGSHSNVDADGNRELKTDNRR
jgi:hypothetical protein